MADESIFIYFLGGVGGYEYFILYGFIKSCLHALLVNLHSFMCPGQKKTKLITHSQSTHKLTVIRVTDIWNYSPYTVTQRDKLVNEGGGGIAFITWLPHTLIIIQFNFHTSISPSLINLNLENSDMITWARVQLNLLILNIQSLIVNSMWIFDALTLIQ